MHIKNKCEVLALAHIDDNFARTSSIVHFSLLSAYSNGIWINAMQWRKFGRTFELFLLFSRLIEYVCERDVQFVYVHSITESCLICMSIELIRRAHRHAQTFALQVTKSYFIKDSNFPTTYYILHFELGKNDRSIPSPKKTRITIFSIMKKIKNFIASWYNLLAAELRISLELRSNLYDAKVTCVVLLTDLWMHNLLYRSLGFNWIWFDYVRYRNVHIFY